MTYYKQQQKSLQKGLVALHTLGKSLGNQQETTWLLEMEAEKKQKQSKKKKGEKVHFICHCCYNEINTTIKATAQ